MQTSQYAFANGAGEWIETDGGFEVLLKFVGRRLGLVTVDGQVEIVDQATPVDASGEPFVDSLRSSLVSDFYGNAITWSGICSREWNFFAVQRALDPLTTGSNVSVTWLPAFHAFRVVWQGQETFDCLVYSSKRRQHWVDTCVLLQPFLSARVQLAPKETAPSSPEKVAQAVGEMWQTMIHSYHLVKSNKAGVLIQVDHAHLDRVLYAFGHVMILIGKQNQNYKVVDASYLCPFLFGDFCQGAVAHRMHRDFEQVLSNLLSENDAQLVESCVVERVERCPVPDSRRLRSELQEFVRGNHKKARLDLLACALIFREYSMPFCVRVAQTKSPLMDEWSRWAQSCLELFLFHTDIYEIAKKSKLV